MATATLFSLLVGVAVRSAVLASHPTCRRDYKKIGCYHEDATGDALINDRDKNSPTFQGITIDWVNYEAYLHGLACRCSAKAKAGMYDHFSIRFFGICYGLRSPAKKWEWPEKSCAAKYNGKINDCLKNLTVECAGRDLADYIYEVGRDGGYGPWGTYGECSTTCGEGVQTRSRECNNPAPLANGNTCDVLGPARESRLCKLRDCPVDGRWGAFSEWSECKAVSATKRALDNPCPMGQSKRTRACDNPPPAFGGSHCVGSSEEVKECQVLCSIDGGFSKWSDFTICSTSCGGGMQSRIRECNNPSPFGPLGKACAGATKEYRECNTQLCPVDGGFGAWSNYGTCSASCGNGTKSRHRKCDSPPPVGGGKDCTGPREETQPCNERLCAVDGGFGPWTTFSDCTKTCDGGVQVRTRNCDNPAPIGGGKDCDGPRQESRGCKNDLCPGVEGVAKAQELVENFLKGFHKTKFPDKEPSGKFYKAIFDIQKAVADEFISVDPTAKGKTIEERLLDLENFLKVATAGGSINFARATLGKGLYTFMKKKIQDGLPIDDIDRAASNYLDKVKDDIGGDLFSQLLSSQGDATLMFTIDTTGSMADEIAAAKAIAKAIIDQTRDFKVDYILSPFNDPTTGPVTYKSETERAGFVSAIDGLTANGGGDCPELAIKGMSNALDAGPRYASPMFVFTDASALDDSPENVAALKASAAANSATINFFANLQGCPEKGIKTYEEIASYTAGQLFPLNSDAELLKFTSYVSKSLSTDTVIASGGTRNTGRPRRAVGGMSHTFNIDDGISEFAVSVSVTTQNTAAQVTLTRPDGSQVAATTSMVLVAIFEVKSPPAGTWTLNFPASVGEYTFNVQAVSAKAMEFAHYFVYQESAAKNSPPFALENPVRDVANMMVIRLGGVELMDGATLRCDLVDERNNLLVGDLKLDSLDSSEVKKTTVTPPNQPFKVRLSGKTKSGSNFQRQSRSSSNPVQAFMRVTYAGNEFTATLGQTNVQIQIQIVNLGAQEDVTFIARATYGQVTPATQTTLTRRSTFIRLAYNAPNDASKKGKTERITVIATSVSGSKYSTSIEILLV